MYKYIGRGPVVRFLAFKLLSHVIIVITRVQSPESREHNIDIYTRVP